MEIRHIKSDRIEELNALLEQAYKEGGQLAHMYLERKSSVFEALVFFPGGTLAYVWKRNEKYLNFSPTKDHLDTVRTGRLVHATFFHARELAEKKAGHIDPRDLFDCRIVPVRVIETDEKQ